MGDLPDKFPERRASEDKARRKDSYWLVGTVVESDKQPLHKPLCKCLFQFIMFINLTNYMKLLSTFEFHNNSNLRNI